MNDLLNFIMNPPQGPDEGIQADVHARNICPHDMALLPDLGWVRVVNNRSGLIPRAITGSCSRSLTLRALITP